MRLPARLPGRDERADARAGGARRAPAALRVLVVDDNVDAAESLAVLLRLLGPRGADGPRRPRGARRGRRTQQPEVVLLDIGLPGLDGYEVARRLREDPAMDGALLVALTGYGQDEDRRRSREAGFDHHFVKPVEPFVLRTLLSNLGAPVASGPF